MLRQLKKVGKSVSVLYRQFIIHKYHNVYDPQMGPYISQSLHGTPRSKVCLTHIHETCFTRSFIFYIILSFLSHILIFIFFPLILLLTLHILNDIILL